MADDGIQRPSAGSAEQVSTADSPTTGRIGGGTVSWEEKYLYYESLSPGERSCAAVAAKFGGSVRTVETHCRNERWRERIRKVEQEAAARSHEMLVEHRIERVRTFLRLIDDSLSRYEQGLREGMRMGPADLERLHRLFHAVLEELSVTSQPNGPPPKAPERTPEHLAAVLDALAESGALEQLGLQRLTPQDLERNPEGGSR